MICGRWLAMLSDWTPSCCLTCSACSLALSCARFASTRAPRPCVTASVRDLVNVVRKFRSAAAAPSVPSAVPTTRPCASIVVSRARAAAVVATPVDSVAETPDRVEALLRVSWPPEMVEVTETLIELAESRLRPLYTELLMKVFSWPIMAAKSFDRIDCWLLVFDGFEASTALALIWASRFDTEVAPAIAVWMMPVPDERLCCTASKALRSERMPWAIEKSEALSCGPVTFRPVEMRFCVVVNDDWVMSRFDSATIAPTLVLTEVIAQLLF